MARRSSEPDPYEVLGVSRDASDEEIRRARRRLALSQHPDMGGSDAAMQRINQAAAAALGAVAASPASAGTAQSGPPRRVGRDHPSFTIEALPAEAFEALLIVGSMVGQVGDDDPPYRLELLLEEPPGTWCRLEIVPDGGGSTVSLTVATDDAVVALDDVRDRFVAELNRLDWNPDGPRPPRLS